MKLMQKLTLLAGASLLAWTAVEAGELDVSFDGQDWNNSPGNNSFWKISTPGDVYVYFAESEDECVLTRTTVLGDGKELTGDYAIVNDRLVVVEDVEWIQEDCEGSWVLAERTHDWYGHDDHGNIWYFGEYTEAYEDGECSVDGSWEAGIDGATPGIVLPGFPQVGDAYQQEYLEDEAEDWGKALQLNATVTGGRYEDLYDESYPPGYPFAGCLKTKEWTPLERGSVEHKFYCPDSRPGLVYIKELKGVTVHVEYVGSEMPVELELPTGFGESCE